MPLINCETSLMLTWSINCVICGAIRAKTSAITNTKLCVPVVTSSAHYDKNLLQQLKSGFKRTINWNNYQSNVSMQAQNHFLDYLTDPCFEGINRLFVLSFEDNAVRARHTAKVEISKILPKVEIKYCNFIIDGRNFFDQPEIELHINIRKYEWSCYWSRR